MSGALQHRGSDDEGYVLLRRVDGAFAAYCGDDSPEEISGRLPLLSTCYNRPCFDVGLAHRRFSIIDPSHRGHQPFIDSSGVGCLAFNGEIYNYVELKRELEGLGHCFRTGTDTEVLLEAYKAWGTECFTRFNGMWALLLYDFRQKRLIVSRDRLGKSPLYWIRQGGSLYFASEIKALLALPELCSMLTVNEAAVELFLKEGLRDLDGTTFFSEIRTFPAASWDLVTEDFPCTTRYWQPLQNRLKERDISVNEAAE